MAWSEWGGVFVDEHGSVGDVWEFATQEAYEVTPGRSAAPSGRHDRRTGIQTIPA
jgi:hypothetical protein